MNAKLTWNAIEFVSDWITQHDKTLSCFVTGSLYVMFYFLSIQIDGVDELKRESECGRMDRTNEPGPESEYHLYVVWVCVFAVTRPETMGDRNSAKVNKNTTTKQTFDSIVCKIWATFICSVNDAFANVISLSCRLTSKIESINCQHTAIV